MRFRANLAAASALLVLAIWLSSGTMAPYASTFFRPIVSTPCRYLYNPDHPLHEAAFWMLDRQPPDRWQSSIVLRRLLFPLAAYPFMKVAGFEVGGFIASVLCHLAALAALALFLRRRYGDEAALAGMWLLAVYPGITYWAALPYANAAIVPASIALYVLLADLAEDLGLGAVALRSTAMGVLFTAYDLSPFFGLAGLLILLRRRRFAALPLAAACMSAGPVLSWLLLEKVFHVPWANTNTALYAIVARAYLHPPALGIWVRSLSDFLPAAIGTFFYSNLLFLPALFIAVVVIARRPLTLPEGALFVSVAVVFLFNNLAPPYAGRWQMRGVFIPRLYQPMFVGLLCYCARLLGDWRALPPFKARLVFAVSVLAFAANASIAFGPIARVSWAGFVYQRFYQHSDPGTMDANLARYGRRPLGFCADGK
ncbi:MAG TPA: hypothetical protein VKO16_01180, partial [Polyangia bacterium]|nr:hypothetical protein [Polyangia bacterium]